MKKYIARGVLVMFVISFTGAFCWSMMTVTQGIVNTPIEESKHALSIFAAFAVIMIPISAIVGGILFALRWALDNA